MPSRITRSYGSLWASASASSESSVSSQLWQIASREWARNCSPSGASSTIRARLIVSPASGSAMGWGELARAGSGRSTWTVVPALRSTLTSTRPLSDSISSRAMSSPSPPVDLRSPVRCRRS